MDSVLIAALAAAFVVSVIDYWRHLGIYRSLIAFAVAGIYFIPAAKGALGFQEFVAPAAASAFIAIASISLLERALARVHTVNRGGR